MPKLYVVVTGSCEASHIYRHSTLNLNLLRLKYRYKPFKFFYFGAKSVTHWNILPTYLAKLHCLLQHLG